MTSDYFKIRYVHQKNRDSVWNDVVKYLEKRVGVPKSALEIAAGYCSLINSSRATKKWATDLNPELRDFCSPEVTPIVGDARQVISDFPYRVDHIYISNFLEHVDKVYAKEILESCKRILHPSGKIVIIQPNYPYCIKSYFDDYTHITVYSHIALCDFLKSIGFEIEMVQRKFLPLTFKSKFSMFSWLTPLYLRSKVKPFAKQMLVVARN